MRTVQGLLKQITFMLLLVGVVFEVVSVGKQPDFCDTIVTKSLEKSLPAQVLVPGDYGIIEEIWISLSDQKTSGKIASDFCQYKDNSNSCTRMMKSLVQEVRYLLHSDLAKDLAEFVICKGTDSLHTHKEMHVRKMNFIQDEARTDSVQTACNIGFNSGQFSLTFLAANPNIKMVAFEMSPTDDPKISTTRIHAAEFMQKRFPNRFIYVGGTSGINSFAQVIGPHTSCDLIFIDGQEHQIDALQRALDKLGTRIKNRDYQLVMVNDISLEGIGQAWKNNKKIIKQGGTLLDTYIFSEEETFYRNEDGNWSICFRSGLKKATSHHLGEEEAEQLDDRVSMHLLVTDEWEPDAWNRKTCTDKQLSSLFQLETMIGLGNFVAAAASS